MRLGIRRKLMLGIGAPLALLSALWVLGTFLGQREEAMRRMETFLSREAQFSAGRLDTRLQVLAQIARSMASFLEAHPDVKEDELYEMLRRNVSQDRLVYGSCVAFEPLAFDPGRRLFAPYVYRGQVGEHAGPTTGLLRMDVANAYDYTDPKWEWFGEPRRTGDPLWTEPFFDAGAGDVAMCTYAAPFFRAGAFRGTVTVDVKLEDLRGYAASTQAPDVTVLMLSKKGTFISWPEPEGVMHESVASLGEQTGRKDLAELGRGMMAGRTATQRIRSPESSATPLLVSYAPIPSASWSFGAAESEAGVMAPVYAGVRDRVLLTLGMISAIVGVTLAIGAWLTRPIERLASAVAALGSNGLDGPPVQANGTDEIGDLARAFNTMVDRLRAQVDELTNQTRAREGVESELRIAREIQRSLLPRELPQAPGLYEVDAFNGAARRVAGDFYDFIALPDGRLALVIADVCGKGIPAAMFMAVARTVVRHLALTERPPGALINEANRALLADNTRGLFVTLLIAVYDPRTGQVRYANAGHPRPWVLSPEGSVRPFGRTTGTVVGVLPEERWEEAQERLEVGDTLVMYTDGVTDAKRPGGEMFGDKRMTELLRGLPGISVKEMCVRIVKRMDEYATRDWPDDVTLLVLRRTG